MDCRYFVSAFYIVCTMSYAYVCICGFKIPDFPFMYVCGLYLYTNVLLYMNWCSTIVAYTIYKLFYLYYNNCYLFIYNTQA